MPRHSPTIRPIIKSSLRGETLEGTFYEYKLQKVVKNENVYKIESILKIQKRKKHQEYILKSGWGIQTPLTPGYANEILYSMLNLSPTQPIYSSSVPLSGGWCARRDYYKSVQPDTRCKK